MPPVSEAGSAVRNRFLAQEPLFFLPETDPCRFSPAISRSASKEGISMLGEDKERDNEQFDTASAPTRTFELHEDPHFWKDNNVQVIIRIRPLNSSEISLHGHRRCVRQDGPQSITWTCQPQSRFTFDIVADENVSQEKLFKVAGLPMVENCMGGYNSCMFAYGQTGSGKTHTMLGDIEGGSGRHSVNCGMTPRVFDYLFSRIQKEKEARRDEKLKFICKCSFLEIYNEHILDLLDPSSLNLQIREDAKKGVYVENLREFEVSSVRDVMEQLLQGAANRKVAATNMNRASSRSHSVFTCVIESKWERQGVSHHRFARLNLVDLAGSERQKSSGAEGDRLKEATNINKSLSTLGLVIMNLVNISNGKAQHVPYRDSKLTFLLQDSLGGNSKTTIIANISPSSCCSLETLSTLKFAQRAKFIRNNAIVNEDTSGDVLALRMQVQQLKKEVNRLRAIANGGPDNPESESLSISFPGSPGSFKWDALQGSLSPLTSDKKVFKKRDLEAALVAAIRREQDKEASLKALAAENQATLQLAKQREAEIQGLKMRLRFREAGIKRLEALTSSKISVEEHLLQEKKELFKEIDILRGQVDRNLDVTRFAMENLKLKEELRRFQSFYEDGEREMLIEQVDILQDKLLEALDWKLMHERDMDRVQDISSHLDYSSIREENEVLQVQAIQYQREVEALRKNLKTCLDAKEKLERRVDGLVFQLEEEKKITENIKESMKKKTDDHNLSRTCDPGTSSVSDQMELKAMVDAIAVASQREAEAHETAIFLEKENDELRKKLKSLIENKAGLIELDEGKVSADDTNMKGMLNEEKVDEDHDNLLHMKDVKVLEEQLHEMHEENDKLMELYENAMQERDALKRKLQSMENNIDQVKRAGYECEETGKLHAEAQVSKAELKMALKKLHLAEDKFNEVVMAMGIFDTIKKTSCEIEKLHEEIEIAEDNNWMKEREIAFIELVYAEVEESRSRVNSRFYGFKSHVSNLHERNHRLEQQEAQARAKLTEFSCLLDQKKKCLADLQARMENVKCAHLKSQEQEITTQNIISNLKSRLEAADNRRKETEKALFVDSTNKPAFLTQNVRPLQLGKAAELLKAEEERTKLPVELRQAEGRLKFIKRDAEQLKVQYKALDMEFQIVEAEVTAANRAVEDANCELQNLTSERGSLLQLREEALEELHLLILNYQTITFEIDSKVEVKKILEEELEAGVGCLKELEAAKLAAVKKTNQLLGDNVKLDALGDTQRYVAEAKAFLVNNVRH
ncbi:Phragmoplast orienting kinesin 2 [Nymphaea thermarum]|nr:Phragmoplast orienting kinesin 2 [Nymphaea thermarum]